MQAVQQSMTPEGAKMSLRGGGEGEGMYTWMCSFTRDDDTNHFLQMSAVVSAPVLPASSAASAAAKRMAIAGTRGDVCGNAMERVCVLFDMFFALLRRLSMDCLTV